MKHLFVTSFLRFGVVVHLRDGYVRHEEVTIAEHSARIEDGRIVIPRELHSLDLSDIHRTKVDEELNLAVHHLFASIIVKR